LSFATHFRLRPMNLVNREYGLRSPKYYDGLMKENFLRKFVWMDYRLILNPMRPQFGCSTMQGITRCGILNKTSAVYLFNLLKGFTTNAGRTGSQLMQNTWLKMGKVSFFLLAAMPVSGYQIR